MDVATLLLAVISSTALAKVFELIGSAGPRNRSLKKRVSDLEDQDLAWREWKRKLQKWATYKDIDTTDAPDAPE